MLPRPGRNFKERKPNTMLRRATCHNLLRGKQRIISMCMLGCFVIAYLPVAGTWFLSLNGRSNLAALVISASRINSPVVASGCEKETSESLSRLFKELKIATGQIKIKKVPDKGKISLIKILPQFPIRPAPFESRIIQKMTGLIFEPDFHYISIFLSIDPPPPRYKVFSLV